MTVTVEEVQAGLLEILGTLAPGEYITIAHKGEEIARLTRSSFGPRPCRAGAYRKAEFWMAPDFDAPLEEFNDDKRTY